MILFFFVFQILLLSIEKRKNRSIYENKLFINQRNSDQIINLDPAQKSTRFSSQDHLKVWATFIHFLCLLAWSHLQLETSAKSPHLGHYVIQGHRISQVLKLD